MSDVCGLLTPDPTPEGTRGLAGAAAALAVEGAERQYSSAHYPHLGLAFWDWEACCPASVRHEPGEWKLWVLGEAFEGGPLLDVKGPAHSRTPEFLSGLLQLILNDGFDVLRELDGEFILVLWNSDRRELAIANDRFGALPLYWTQVADSFAFATGVRALAALPDFKAEPDTETLREAVSFGGYRLGTRTNLKNARMVPGGSVITVRPGEAPRFKRYWSWDHIQPALNPLPLQETIEALHAHWERAIRLRLEGAKSPGQTLSGGLDSRAILAEACDQAPRWTAITFGVAGCDDEKYAQRAASEGNVDWIFHPLYSGRAPDWLEIRSQYIQQTDGLIDLADLQHLETLPLQSRLLDLHVSGYIGDAVSGGTFAEVQDASGILNKLPFYGTTLGLDHGGALAKVEELLPGLNGAALRYFLFEHKLAQSTNRWSAAWRPWFRVRRPFTSYAFFDLCQSVPLDYRTTQRMHERWLLSKYPRFFRDIPNQKSGLPILSPQWKLNATRAQRLLRRKAFPVLKKLRPSSRPRIRNFTNDEDVWRLPSARQRIVSTILRADSISAEVFGREKLETFLRHWADTGSTPAQVIGALYVYEAYHRDLRKARV